MYILVREKKGVPPSKRVEDLISSPVFTGTGRTPRHVLQSKLVALVGDATFERLGLSDSDWFTLISEVNVIINSAASVRFDDPMKKALLINCLSTMSCLQLAKKATQLEAFVHVSTCYANCQLTVVEEKIYPCKTTAEHLMEVSKWMDSDAFDKLCEKQLYEDRPNSYVFTKALAENHLRDHGSGMPIAIGRLSMVVGSRNEPEPGFIDVTQACLFVGFTQALGKWLC